MRIGVLVFAVLMVLGLLSFGLATQRLWTAHTNVVQETRQADLAQARSDWYEGTVALSFERSVTQVALALDTAIPDAFRGLIDQQRQQSDALFDQVLVHLNGLNDFDHREGFLSQVKGQRAKIEDLRQEADRLLSQPSSARAADRAELMPYELKAEIERLFSSASLLVLKDGSSSTREGAISRVQALAWEVREYAGRARTFYAIATLTGKPIPPHLIGEAQIDTARGIAAWERVQIERQAVDFPQEFNAAFIEADQLFRQTYIPALTQLDQAMEAMRQGAGVAMPLGFEEFFDLSNQGLDAVAGLVPLTGTLVQEYWASHIREASWTRSVSAFTALATLLISFAAAYLLHARVVQPLGAATRALHDISEGNLDREFDHSLRHLEEMRVMWEAMETLNHSLQQARDAAEEERAADAHARAAEERTKQGIVGELMKGLECMAQGDLTYEIRGDFGEAYGDLIDNFNRTGMTLREAIGNVVQTANHIAQHSDGLSVAIAELSGRSEDQMRIVSETARGLRTLIDMLEETARNTEGSLQTATEAARKSEAGLQVVDCAIRAMDDIHTSSDSIRGFGNVIDEIAFQTNLLALNAGVEAARAGDSGKGFGVVAQEVRGLASQASDAAQQVKEQVETSAVSVTSGVEEVKKTGQSLKAIYEMVGEAQKRMEQIERDSRQQSGTVARLGETMEEVDGISRQNAEMAIQVTGTSATLKDSAEALRASVARFAIGQGSDDLGWDRKSA